MLQRGDPGHVLVQDVMLPLLERQGPQVLDGGIEAARCPERGGIEDQVERAESVLLPVLYACMICPRLPWQMSRASLCRDSWMVSCRLIWCP